MDFEEFARSFRQRTASRLIEFEHSLAKAQADIEKAAREARAQQGRSQVGPQGASASPGKEGYGQQTACHPRQQVGQSRQVKSVFRRG
ncbi:hypothetical protein [Corynebacterium lizhenjunii]|uniref:hypothetical protein n=1 Tax=Corynebacterium lizhenjunii TaxID=2709394 RepID=UPI0013ED23A7|nr:hypothetical protein [Corynebacterium lizhenjunii]